MEEGVRGVPVREAQLRTGFLNFRLNTFCEIYENCEQPYTKNALKRLQ